MSSPGTCPYDFAAPICGGNPTLCAYHSNDPATGVAYTNLPYLPDAGSYCGRDFVNKSGQYDGWSMVGGHEYAETITDPYPPSAQPYHGGWIDLADAVSGGEVGDKCAWGGEGWGGHDPYGDVKLATGTFAMQSLWSNAAHACVMTYRVKDVVTITPRLGNQFSYRTVGVRIALRSTSSSLNVRYWSASGLPAGLAIDRTTGVISGIPTTIGVYKTRIRVYDNAGASATDSFTWTVSRVIGKPVKGYAGLCLGETAQYPGNGTVSGVWTCDNSPGERWQLTRSGGLVVLGKCLDDISHGGRFAHLVLYTCNGASAQTWTHRSNGEYVLRLNGLCLTDPGTRQSR